VSHILDQQNDDRSYRHFMQDNAMVHSAKNCIDALDVFCEPNISTKTVDSMITQFKSFWLLFVEHTERSVCEQSKILGMKFPLFPYSNIDVYLKQVLMTSSMLRSRRSSLSDSSIQLESMP
jgi:hypothetical protein